MQPPFPTVGGGKKGNRCQFGEMQQPVQLHRYGRNRTRVTRYEQNIVWAHRREKKKRSVIQMSATSPKCLDLHWVSPSSANPPHFCLSPSSHITCSVHGFLSVAFNRLTKPPCSLSSTFSFFSLLESIACPFFFLHCTSTLAYCSCVPMTKMYCVRKRKEEKLILTSDILRIFFVKSLPRLFHLWLSLYGGGGGGGGEYSNASKATRTVNRQMVRLICTLKSSYRRLLNPTTWMLYSFLILVVYAKKQTPQKMHKFHNMCLEQKVANTQV